MIYTRVSLSELVPLSRPPLCNSLSERTRYRNILVIGTICNVLVIGTALCDSLSERTRYRNVLVIGTNCSDNEYTCTLVFSGTLVHLYSVVHLYTCIEWYTCTLVFSGTDLYTSIVPIRSTAGHTPYTNKLFKKRAPASVA